MVDQIKYIVIFIGVLIGLYVFFKEPLRGIMYIVAFQKIIDIFWFVSINAGGLRLNVQGILYTLIPIGLIFVILQIKNRSKKFSFNAPMVIVIFVFILYFTWEFLRSPVLVQMIPAYFKVIGPFLIFGAGWFYFDNEKKFDEFGKLYVFSYSVPFIGWFLQFFNIFSLSDIGIRQQGAASIGFEDAVFRYSGFYNDPHTLAYPLATVVPICLYMINRSDDVKSKIAYFLMLLITIPIFATGYSRSTMGSMFVCLIIWLYFSRKYLILMLIGVVGLISFVQMEFFHRIFSDLFVTYEQGLFSASYSGRTGYWAIVIDGFNKLEIPEKLLGMGFGSHVLISPIFGNPQQGYTSAHSDFLEYLYELGYLGVGMLNIILALIMIKSIKNVHRCEKYKISDLLKGKYITILPIVVFFFSIETVGWPSRSPAVTWPMWFIAGFAFKHPLFYLAQSLKDARPNYVQVNPKLALT